MPDEVRMRDVEVEVARNTTKIDHVHECVESLKEKVEELTESIISLEKTVLVKFGEMNGRDMQARRIAVVVSTVVSIIVAVASVAIASIL
jgi:predicted nuclease with TOPRIM domain